jgi:osmotically inducible protein OsmC
MGISKGSAHWDGGFKSGHGAMKPAHAPEAPFTAASRFEGAPSSNPEELIGAALAGCFSMAFTLALEKAGAQPTRVHTDADVTIEKQPDGFAITGIALTTRASVTGIDAERFQDIAEQTKRTCPVSKALTGTKVTLRAVLA